MRGDKDHETELRSRGYTEEHLKRINQKTPDVKVNGLIFSRPLTNFKYELIGYVLILAENYEKGNLPFPGSVSEQPGQIMDILNVIQNLKIEYKNKIEKEAMTKSTKRG